jgi:hypothetical protein
MTAILAGQDLGHRLVPLLGLPPHTLWFELRCAANEFVTVKCEYAPDIDKSFDTVLAEYELVPLAHPEPATIGHFDDWMRERTNAAHTAYMERIACLPN